MYNCSIAQLFDFRSNIAQRSCIEPYSIGVKSGSPGCLCIILSIPRALTPLFVEALDPDIPNEEEIVSINVDAVNLLEYKRCLQDHYPLVKAALRGYSEVLITIMEGGSDVNQQDEYGNTALIWASYKGYHNVVISLLSVPGININIQDEDGRTALMLAIISNHNDVALSLSTVADINVNVQDKYGDTALHRVCNRGRNDVVQALVASPGIGVNIQSKNGDTALHNACHMGRIDVVQALVASPGIEVNTQNKDGLMKAILNHRTQSSLTVIATPGVDINKVNQDGLTALITATQQNNIQVVESLLKVEGVAMDIQEKSAGWSTLFFAAEKGYLEIVQLLLNAGADTTLSDKEGVTALDVATVHEQEAVVAELEKHHSGSSKALSPGKQTDSSSDPGTPRKTIKERVLHAGKRVRTLFVRLFEDTALRSQKEKREHVQQALLHKHQSLSDRSTLDSQQPASSAVTSGPLPPT